MSYIVINKITLSGANQERIEEVFNFFKGVNGDMDFNKIITMPEELVHTRKGSREDEAWACFLAKELGNNEEIDELLTWDWVMEAGITVREKLVDYLEKVHEEDEKTCPEELKTGFATLYDYGKYQYELHKKYGYRNHVDWALDNWGSSWNASDIEKEENTLKFTTYTSSIGNLMLATSAKFPDVNIVYEFCSQDLEGVGRLTIKEGKMVSVLFPNAGTKKQLDLATEILGYRPEI